MAFGKKKDGLYLRPRVRRTTPLMDIGFAMIMGGISGVYIFNDTLRRWQNDEIEMDQEKGGAGKPVIPGADQQKSD